MVIIYSIEPYAPKQYRGGTYGPNARGRHGAHRLSTPCDTAMTERERLEASERRVDVARGCESDVSCMAGCGQAGTRYPETRGWARDWAL